MWEMSVGSVRGWRHARSGSYRTAWAFLVAAVVCGTAGLVINKAAGNPSKLPKSTVLELGGTVIVLWVIAAVLLLFAISRFNRARHAAEQQQKQSAARLLAAEHVTQARRLAEQLLAGEASDVGQVWDVVLQQGERVLLDGTAGYSRHYALGPAATRAQHGARYQGNAVAVRAPLGHAVDRTGNGRRAQGAADAVAARWRDHQQARVVLSDRRLLCQLPAKGWVGFDHAAARAIRAVPETRSVVLEYPDLAPLCLSGPMTAQVMVVVIWALYGAEGLREHPALAEVRSIAPLPDVSADGGARRSAREAPTIPAPVAIDPTSTADAAATGALHPDLLAFVVARELVLAEHAARLLGVSERDATAQLEQLIEQGLVSRVRLSVDTPTAYRITQRGAGQVDTALRPPGQIDLADYARAVAVPGM